MWWKWTIFIFSAILILGCVVDTTYNWIKGNTGPLGPNPWDWWGCGIFTIILAAVMFCVGKYIF